MRLKTKEDIKILREGGHKLAAVVHGIAREAEPGMDVSELNMRAEKRIKKTGGMPSFKGFQGFPAATCISINEGLVHGIPREGIVLKEGDIVSIDIGLKYKGLFTDMAVTVPIGSVSADVQKLIGVTKRSLFRGIRASRPGRTIGDIGNAIQTFIESQQYGVVRTLVGHGVGYAVHEEPRVPNFGKPGEGPELQPGLVIALEPMVTIGSPEVTTLDDEWTIQTRDGSLCAHYEHTIAITEEGSEILTQE